MSEYIITLPYFIPHTVYRFRRLTIFTMTHARRWHGENCCNDEACL